MMLENIAQGASVILTPYNIFFCWLGSSAGLLLGATPGISATMSIALLVPLTFTLSPATGLIMLGGIYCGAIYGGSIASILLRTPGTPASAATVYDGYAMTQKGEAGKALGLAIFASVTGGFMSALVLLFAAPQVAKVALKFRSAEMFWLVVFGLTIVASVTGKSIVKGLITALLGLVLATIGMHPMTGFMRFSFGFASLYDGIPFIVALIGLFSISQAMVLVERGGEEKQVTVPKIGRVFPGWKLLYRLKWTSIRSALIGIGIGAVPGPGATISAFVAYDQAKRLSKTPEKFGTGIPEGVVAPEAANNGVTGGSLIPMLTLGIPGNECTAALLGGVMIHGLIPGPKLFTQHAPITYAFMLSMILNELFYSSFGFLFVKYLAKMVLIPRGILAPVIVVLSVIGSYAIRCSLIDVGFMFGMGLLGYALRKLKFPLVPIILGMILGPLAEENLARSITIAHARGTNLLFFFISSPIALVFMIITGLSLGWSIYKRATTEVISEEGL